MGWIMAWGGAPRQRKLLAAARDQGSDVNRIPI